MAIKAKDQVTIVDFTDIKAVTVYYLLQLSTLAAPVKPTTASPSGWTTTEPAFDNTSTKILYTCVKNTFGDGSFSWGDVSVSSSYEASKQAYIKADNAQSTATTANNKIASWGAANDTTMINGGKIYTGSVTADKINASTLSAISANLGTVTAGTMQSANYSESAVISWDPLYSGVTVTNGMKINLTTGTISTPHLMMDENGVLKINGELYSIGSPSVIQVKSGGLQLLDGYDETHPQVGKIAVVAKTSGSTTTNCFDISTGSYDAYIESKNLHIVSTGKTSTNGALDVGGKITAVNGTISGLLTVTGTTQSGAVSVTGTTDTNTLNVSGAATAASLSVTGATTSGTGSITGALSVGGKITNGTTFIPKFFAGTTVANLGGGNSYPIFSTSELNSTFGVTNVTGQNTVAFFANGDGGASAAHTTGATFLNSDNKWYVTTDRNVPGLMRVNYLVIYFG